MQIISKIIQTAAEQAEQANPQIDGDYIQDGLLYCGNCNTPKQVEITLFGRSKIVFCLCECATAKRDNRIWNNNRAEKKQYIKRVIEEMDGGASDEAKFENDNGKTPKVITFARNYVNRFEEFKSIGKGLILFGSKGSGKTFTATCIGNALIEQLHPVFMTSIIRISNTISGMKTPKDEYFRSFEAFDLVILDDLGAERDTEYQNEIVFTVIDHLYRNNIPVIVTTNYTGDEIKSTKSPSLQRIFSRLREMCMPFDCGNHDLREDILKADMRKYQESLLEGINS